MNAKEEYKKKIYQNTNLKKLIKFFINKSNKYIYFYHTLLFT